MLNELYSDLRMALSGEVRFDKLTRQLYSTDASMYQIEPLGVVHPRHADDMRAVVEIARKHALPVLPRGGGTSLAGQCVGRAVMMDLATHMNHILELNLEEEWVRVEPGVVQDQLNSYLAPHGYAFGPDTSTSNRATLGGMTGNNSCGARSIIYGKTLDHVLEADVILSDGSRAIFGALDDSAREAKLRGEGLEGHIYREVLRIAEENRDEVAARFPKIMRRVSGYNLDEVLKEGPLNLAKLLVGSEGTLAVWSGLKLRIVPLPTMKALLVVHFPDMISAVESDALILEHHPSAMELVDDTIISEAVKSPAFAGQTGFLEGSPGAIIVVEFYGESAAELTGKLDKLEAALKRNKMGYAHVRATTPGDQAQVWNLRKAGLGLLMGQRIDAKPLPFVEDTAVDPLKLPVFLKAFEKIVKKHGVRAGYYGHASVGCLHIRPFLDLKQPGEKERLMAIFEDVASLVEEHGGSISGEHGDGLARSWLIERLFGAKLAQAFKDVKTTFDPANIMNPGKIVDPQQPLENLRWGKPIVNDPDTFLDFSPEGGFAFAVEMCNGNGNCRKLDVGTMCPSYQVTRKDIDSTRGRANAFRALLQGDLPPGELYSPEMAEAMDLCLECKACKTECPSQVDMAKMKYEYLYQYQLKNGVPLRSRIFGNLDRLSRLGSALAPFSNWAMRTPPHRWLMSMLGISPKRRMPPFRRRTFSRWFHRRNKANDSTQSQMPASQPAVVLFHDTFVEHNVPELGRDAVAVLEAAGFEVILPDRKCCARPMISKGLLEKAREYAAHNVAILKPYAQAGLPIVGVEPSCILTLKEDYPSLLPGPDTELVAGQVRTIDELLAELTEAGRLPYPNTEPPARSYLLHAHCHQKALVGTGPTLAVLRGIPGADVGEIPSGCCGMAGSFGYEKEHYDISQAIGEQRLFPAVRQAPADTQIVACGISCRQQIAHGTGRESRHLVEVVAEALRG
ncbi:MAG: anaerobic glycerol-3-phosphate dehydrogenase subunit C [SAR324 cluster bacterium]|nr:anaerobic glycerol-3-phosphate dehydrogenase subunit C [SAR324 cluster bacterium]